MNIKTNAKTNAKGTLQIVAKGGGKQKTVNVDPAHSADQSHGDAAGTLALTLGLKWSDSITHTVSGDTHTFTWA